MPRVKQCEPLHSRSSWGIKAISNDTSPELHRLDYRGTRKGENYLTCLLADLRQHLKGGISNMERSGAPSPKPSPPHACASQ